MASAALRPTYRRGLSFLAGVGFAALPAVGPFLALLALTTGRIEIQRADRWWWVAAVLLAAPYAWTGYPVDAGRELLQVLAVWLIYRSAALVRRGLRHASTPADVGLGLVVGLAIALAIGARQMDALRWDTALTALDLITWQAHPTLFAHSLLVLSALLGIAVPAPRLRVVALALGALAAVLAGAGEALFAWLLIAVGLRFVARRGDRLTRAAEWALIGAMLVLVSGIGALIGLGRPGFLTDLVDRPQPANLFRGTEIGGGDWWHALGVQYATAPASVAGSDRTAFVVTKVSDDAWARLQQVVTLEPAVSYTLSVAWRAGDELRPGLDGWGRPAGSGTPAVLTSTLRGSTLRAAGSGGIEVLGTDLTTTPDGWTRAAASFRYLGDAPLVWHAGAVVDRSERTGVRATFAELQLRPGDAAVGYLPGPADRGVIDLRTSRFPIWQDALAAVATRPLRGWGPAGLPRSVDALRPEESRERPVAAHAHNQLLAVTVDRGLIGLVGLLILVVSLALRSVQQRDRAAVVVLAGIAVLNLFDATLLSGGVIYPLAAVLGWRAVGNRDVAESETGVASAGAVRVGLAVADVASAAAALTVAALVVGQGDPLARLATAWSPTLAYALLAWPLMAGLVGLYPGYGLAGGDELARTVRAAAAAGALFVFLASAFPDLLAVPFATVLSTVALALLAAPFARQSAKLLLRRLRLWGRPVVVLGGGAISEAVTHHLHRHPGVGLHPVALFGEPPAGDLPVPHGGDLDQAWAFLRANGIRHVIVSPEAARRVGYDEVLRRAHRWVRYVQFLPDLHGLPSAFVAATPLGMSLALEARNQLASGTNRAVKRFVDVAGSALGLLLLGLPLLALGVWVRLDSRGPALYLSPRLGLRGTTFHCVKFRTMHVDAEARLERLLAADPALRAEYERFHKLADDPRITRAGRWLRRASLDELPQLLNVLTGQMSLVGPRPYLVRELAQMGPDSDIIFLARPGMTGYWQVEGRNDVTFEERQDIEAAYVRNWSVWWDLEILARTPLVILERTGK